jgi:hypothetical protein
MLYVHSGITFMTTSVVALGVCRELFAVADDLRKQIKAGARGIAVCVMRDDGTESVVFAGVYRDDPDAALKTAMAISWELTKRTSPPLT